MAAKRKNPGPPQAVPGRRRILLVEDHPLMREGVASCLNEAPDLEVCGLADSVGEALRRLEKACPDLVLADLTLPGRSGIELIKDLHALQPSLPVLILSNHDEATYALRALRAGARGYVSKRTGGQNIIAAVRRVLDGHTAFSDRVLEQVMNDFTGRQRGHHSPLAVLSDREFEVLQLIGNGCTNQEIARQLHLSVKTVETHRTHAREKLGLKSTPELIRFAVQQLHSAPGEKRPS